MKCKNKEIKVIGAEYNGITNMVDLKELNCICTNDKHGKTLSIDNGIIQFSIPMDALIKFFK